MKMIKRFCAQFLALLQVGVDDRDIRGVLRLCKYADIRGQDQATATNSRPLLIQLNNRTAKNLVMENLYKIKSLEERFNNIVVSHDMTQKERMECKALVEEAKQKAVDDPSGEYICRVGGHPGQLRIVQLRRR